MKVVEFVGTAPEMKTSGAVAFDLRSASRVVIRPGEIVKVGTGTRVKLPEGTEGLLNVRSSVGNRGLLLSNGTGIIDTDYTGELIFSLYNANISFPDLLRFYDSDLGVEYGELPPGTIVIEEGERIGQLRVRSVLNVSLRQVDELEETERGSGGFGSTGRD